MPNSKSMPKNNKVLRIPSISKEKARAHAKKTHSPESMAKRPRRRVREGIPPPPDFSEDYPGEDLWRDVYARDLYSRGAGPYIDPNQQLTYAWHEVPEGSIIDIQGRKRWIPMTLKQFRLLTPASVDPATLEVFTYPTVTGWNRHTR